MKSLNFIAHPDDDFLLFNPDIAEDLEQGDEVEIIYFTYGDDGKDENYIWHKRHSLQEVYYSTYSNAKLRLSFIGIKSNSFKNGDTWGDLYQMWHNPLHEAKTIGPSWSKSYTREVLLHDLSYHIDTFQPDLIRMHNPFADPAIDHDEPSLDHLDHIYSAKFALSATPDNIPIFFYIGYQIRSAPSNLSPEQIALKTKLWRLYQAQEPEVAGEQWDVAMSRCYKMNLQ